MVRSQSIAVVKYSSGRLVAAHDYGMWRTLQQW